MAENTFKPTSLLVFELWLCVPEFYKRKTNLTLSCYLKM